MSGIVVAGLPPALEAQLSLRLPGVKLKFTNSGGGLLTALAEDEFALLILDHSLLEPAAVETLAEVRKSQRSSVLPVIYCLGSDAPRDLPATLVRDFGVAAVLYHPLDASELIRQASSLLESAELREAAEPGPQQPQPPVDVMVERFAAVFQERVEVLEKAGLALLEGRLTPDLRRDAEREAHRLAGSLGTMGLQAGSRFAREVESFLQHTSGLSEQEALRFSELVVALRLVLERGPVQPGAGAPPASFRHHVLLVSGDEALADKLRAEAFVRGLELEHARDLGAARDLARRQRPALAILDFGPADGAEQWRGWLETFGTGHPSIPAVVLTGKGTLFDRVEVARRGGRGFLPRSLSADEVMEFTLRLADRLRAPGTRVLAVDDDPQVLEALRQLFEPRGLGVTVLDDPLKFWEIFNHVAPDLLILDLDMPHLTGIELCRVIRNDPHWAQVPILFLTVYSDADTVRRVFSAGADDFVAKPVTGPELLARVFNRLDRSRLMRSAREIDPLTRILNRWKGRLALDDFMRLAQRYRQPLALGAINLDHLRQINERSGYGAGDAVLRQLGGLMQRLFRSEDVAVRWGGEDLVVGMYGMSRSDGVQRVAELLEVFRRTPGVDGDAGEVPATFSAGVAVYPDDASEIDGLFVAAREAMRLAKAAGRDRVLPAGWDARQRHELTNVDVVLVTADAAGACLLSTALETRGYRCRCLEDGQTAIKLLAGTRPRLRARVILLEVELPGRDGLSVLQQMAAHGRLKESKVIMLTSPSVGDDAQAALRLGAFDEVVKPFNPPVIAQRIRRALES